MEVLPGAIAHRPAHNGTEPVAAAALAHQLLGAERTTIVTISDGVFGEISTPALLAAFDARPGAIDVHAIALVAGRMSGPTGDAWRAPAVTHAGSYVELSTEQLDAALARADSWLHPAWLELAIGAEPAVPDEILAGAGAVTFQIARALPPAMLVGHREQPIRIAARPGPAAPLAQLALANAGELEARGELTRARPAVDGAHALAVLATTGRVARDRRAMVAGGGPYTRMLAVEDPPFPQTEPAAAPAPIVASAVDRGVLERLFQLQLQPKAYACYERALSRAHALTGTVTFHLELGRGEITRVALDGIGDPVFEACLIDAAYGLAPPLPNPDVNLDDRTLANYPITFTVHGDRAVIVAGDADSSEPIDIEAVKPGLPRQVKVNAVTPLGDLRPSPSP
jgi:hypothetical protein